MGAATVARVRPDAGHRPFRGFEAPRQASLRRGAATICPCAASSRCQSNLAPCGRCERIELIPTIVFHARPVSLHEAISPRRPRAVDVDHIVPLGRPDLRQEPRLQDIAEKASQAATITCLENPKPCSSAEVPRTLLAIGRNWRLSDWVTTW